MTPHPTPDAALSDEAVVRQIARDAFASEYEKRGLIDLAASVRIGKMAPAYKTIFGWVHLGARAAASALRPAALSHALAKLTPLEIQRVAFNLSGEFGAEFVLPLEAFALAAYREIDAALRARPAAPAEPVGVAAPDLIESTLRWLIDDVQEWCDAVGRNSSWDGWDHHYKALAYGNLEKARSALVASPADASGADTCPTCGAVDHRRCELPSDVGCDHPELLAEVKADLAPLFGATPARDDLVERLRSSTPINLRGPNYEAIMVEPGSLRLEAADRIERLTALHREDRQMIDAMRRRAEGAELAITRKDRALRGAREMILDMKNARWSEREGSDSEWVSDIDAALSSTPPADGTPETGVDQ